MAAGFVALKAQDMIRQQAVVLPVPLAQLHVENSAVMQLLPSAMFLQQFQAGILPAPTAAPQMHITAIMNTVATTLKAAPKKDARIIAQ